MLNAVSTIGIDPIVHRILSETLLSSAEAKKHPVFRRAGDPLKAFYRAILNGTVGAGESRIFLEKVRLPSGWHTSAEAIERYVTKLTGGTVIPAPQPKRRRKEIESAEAELTAAGMI